MRVYCSNYSIQDITSRLQTHPFTFVVLFIATFYVKKRNVPLIEFEEEKNWAIRWKYSYSHRSSVSLIRYSFIMGKFNIFSGSALSTLIFSYPWISVNARISIIRNQHFELDSSSSTTVILLIVSWTNRSLNGTTLCADNTLCNQFSFKGRESWSHKTRTAFDRPRNTPILLCLFFTIRIIHRF